MVVNIRIGIDEYDVKKNIIEYNKNPLIKHKTDLDTELDRFQNYVLDKIIDGIAYCLDQDMDTFYKTYDIEADVK